MKTIVFANMKGGVGKSTSVYSTAAALATRGKRVLICDSDPQANTTDTAGIDILEVPVTLRNIFNGADIHNGIYHLRDHLDIVTAGLEMVNADRMYTGMGREFLLRKALAPVRNEYDYIIIDTSPFFGLMTTAALVAADIVVIPTKADKYSISGIHQLEGLIANVTESPYNPGLIVSGLLVTMYNDRTVLARVIEDSLQETAASLNSKVYQTRIRQAQAVMDSQFMQEDIFSYGKGKAADDYNRFVSELMEDLEK